MNLFCLANVLKAVFAKMLSSRFHKDNHFKQMAQALTNVRVLCASLWYIAHIWCVPNCMWFCNSCNSRVYAWTHNGL